MIRAKVNAAEKLWGMLCLLPTGWIALFYAFVVRAYFKLGHWPAPYQPDPKDLAFDLHHLAIWLGFPVIIASAVVFGIVVVSQGRKYSHSPRRWMMAMGYIVTLLVGVGLMCIDPGHFLEWFVD
jgi:drug/metabolite transporter (DMT)-like permease